MSVKKRYTNAFLVTFILYAVIFGLMLWSFNAVVYPLNVQNEQTISLNHVALISQEKQVIPPFVPQKQEEPKEEVKKIEKPKPKEKVSKTPAPKEEMLSKNETKEIEQKKESNSDEEAQKIFEKAQEQVEKSIPKNYEEEYLNENLQKIVKLIQQHIQYPKRARELSIQGVVLAQFTLLKTGKIEGLEALQGHVLLKKSALKAIDEASMLFPKVEKDITIKVPIQYSLVEQQ